MPDSPTLAVVLCLNSGLVDLEGRKLYGIRHGLEPVETYAQQTRAVRPVAERLQNPSRLNAVIEATLGPLAAAGPTTPNGSDDGAGATTRPPTPTARSTSP